MSMGEKVGAVGTDSLPPVYNLLSMNNSTNNSTNKSTTNNSTTNNTVDLTEDDKEVGEKVDKRVDPNSPQPRKLDQHTTSESTTSGELRQPLTQKPPATTPVPPATDPATDPAGVGGNEGGNRVGNNEFSSQSIADYLNANGSKLDGVKKREREEPPDPFAPMDDNLGHPLALGNEVIVWWNVQEGYEGKVVGVTEEPQLKQRKLANGNIEDVLEHEYLVFYSDGDSEWLSKSDENPYGFGGGKDADMLEEDSDVKWKFQKIEINKTAAAIAADIAATKGSDVGKRATPAGVKDNNDNNPPASPGGER
eukprot:CAMPEP_0118644602 /NCGR_PEP_ID=MMETSP0785-20121206/7034_1 /TAXON_ID=91992 /ORGANISM="Bolidomonas pacifica, Strain CCMP 1866" /LENGTH=307 /DNA_ID=CAMNT_0006536387 /DNA_START=154 /DNA_END=1077 /DNA_ORIENTATION=+